MFRAVVKPLGSDLSILKDLMAHPPLKPFSFYCSAISLR